MSGIGDLAATMTMDSNAFSGGLREAESSLTSFKDEFKEVGAALGVGLGLERGAEALKGRFEGLTDLIHSSAKLSVPIEQLQVLDYQARQTGVGIESLSTGFGRMEKSIGEGLSGNAEAAGTFRTLGVDINALAGQRPDQQFETIAESISHMSDANLRGCCDEDFRTRRPRIDGHA